MATIIHSRRGTVTRLRRDSQSTSDSDENIYTAPLTPPVSPQYPFGRYPGQWSLRLQLEKWLWSRFSLFILGSMLTYFALFYQRESGLRFTGDIAGINRERISAIPLLYKDVIYNATKMEGNIFKGQLDTFPGDTLSVTRRFAKEMPDYPQVRNISGLLEDLQITSDKVYREYMYYYDAVRRHAEDTMILTNALIEDSKEVAQDWNASDGEPAKIYHLRRWIGKGSYWCYFFTCESQRMLIKAIYLKYLKALLEGYNLPDKHLDNHKSLGLTKVLITGERLLPIFEEAKNKSEVLRFTVELGISKMSSNETSNSEPAYNQGNDTVGYMKNWLENDFASGQHVREIEMPNSIRQFQQALKDIERNIRDLLYILLHMENYPHDHWDVKCHTDAMAKALKYLASYYNFGHPCRPGLVWEVYKCIWKREDTEPLIDSAACNTQHAWGESYGRAAA
ncbi:hypothetical protein OCU04_003426 [Sclerotinia nivalis]|uniref:Uncharacterized protein n=1 Tax=Sclerotinia nivalis TaxID=352851 RepID=A0A9X0DN72_9HELO|nr:hypothetical protein OCU04_003426 [Sclerotinia nivalis]